MQVDIELPENWKMEIEYLEDAKNHDVRVMTESRLKDAKIFDNLLDAVLFAYSLDFGSELDRNMFNRKIRLYVDAVRLT